MIRLIGTYNITIRGNFTKLDHIKSLKALDCITWRLSFNFQWDTPSIKVMEVTMCNSIYDMYKLSLAKLFHNSLMTLTSYISCVERLRLTSEDRICELLRNFLHISRKTLYVIKRLYYGILVRRFSKKSEIRSLT